jgi:hypothetical protein
MEEERAFALLLRRVIRCRQKSRRYKRRYWVHPLISCRLLKGQFYTLFSDLRDNPENFFSYFRMSVKTFDELLFNIREDIAGKDTNMRLPITPEEKYCTAQYK